MMQNVKRSISVKNSGQPTTVIRSEQISEAPIMNPAMKSTPKTRGASA
jgi:hypothetical protein